MKNKTKETAVQRLACAVKKVLSLLLAIAMLFSITAGIDLSAYAAVTLKWPVPGHTRVSNGFHDGNAIDISDGSIGGANIVAAIGGKVTHKFTCGSQHYGSSGDCYGFGTGIVIKGTDGRVYQYAHMQGGSIPSNVYVGASVSTGQVIGKVGTTGNSTGNHLHFGIAYNNYWDYSGINPQNEKYDYSPPEPTNPISFNSLSTTNVSTNSATVEFYTTNPNFNVTKIGLRIKKTNESSWGKTYEENIPASIYANNNPLHTSYVVGSGKEINYTLSQGTSYTWQAYAVANGKTYSSSNNTFKTTGPSTAIITFDGNGGTPSVNSKSYNVGSVYGSQIPSATRDYYSFVGWYTQSSGGTRVDRNSVVTSENKILYAHWIRNFDALENDAIYRIYNFESGLPLEASDTYCHLVYQENYSNNNSQLWKVEKTDKGYKFKNIEYNENLGMLNYGDIYEFKRDICLVSGTIDFDLFTLDYLGRKLNENNVYKDVFIIQNTKTGRVLDIQDESKLPGGALWQYEYHGRDNQLFYFEKVSLNTPEPKVTVNANGTFTLSWNKVTGADKYELYIKQADGSYKLMKTTTATSFTTAFATYGKQFTYKMRAVTGNVKSAYSSAVNATNNKKLQTPTLKATVNANGTFTLSWNKVTGADKYELYIKQADGSYKLMKTTTATSFTTAFATYGKQFSYKMRAVTSKNSSATSAYSSAVNATNNKKLQTPTLKAAVNANGTFTLSWNKVTGADKYELYIKQADGSYKLMKTTTATSFTTAFATYGKQFSYKMRAVTSKNKNAASAYSGVVNAKNTKKLQTPTLKAAVNKNGSFKLSWNKVTGAEKYELYIKQANGSYKLMKTTSSTSFTTAVATKGKTYSYKVRAVTGKNKNAASNYSNAVNAKRK